MNKKASILIIVTLLVIIIGLLSYIMITNQKNNEINLKELIEDIESIKENGEIINAKEREPYSIPSTYYGNGYSITVSLYRDSTEYYIYSNDEKVWQYLKAFSLEER